MHATVHKTFAPISRPTKDHASSLTTVQPNPVGNLIDLQEPQHMHLTDAAGWSVQAVCGTVWVTQDGDIRDIVLEPGDVFVLDRTGPALLAPIGSARIRIAHQDGQAAVSRRKKVSLPSLLARARAAFA